ncbi:MAG: hypothetical protein FWD98_02040 [Defluviitaleaceae bacterium]|nr:hypothetical protein [Defluviitaleaceae bacterium]
MMHEEAQLVIMLRNSATGFLETEYAAMPLAEIGETEALLVNVFAAQGEGGVNIHMKVSTPEDVANWQYNAIYDYYDTEVFARDAASVLEVEDVVNPTWEIVFAWADAERGGAELARKVRAMLEIHRAELDDTLRVIADKEGDYADGV